jgi:hypothetical protein
VEEDRKLLIQVRIPWLFIIQRQLLFELWRLERR